MTQTNAQRLADELDAECDSLASSAAAELRRLDAIEQRHNEMLAHPCSEWDHKAYQQAIANLRAENAQLRAELEAVRRDAERYRWLRLHSYVEVNCDSQRSEDWEPSQLDEAIEAAIDPTQAERAKGG